MSEVKTRFMAIVTQFTNELSLSYPELGPAITKYLKKKDSCLDVFGTLVPTLKEAVAQRNDDFFLKSKGDGPEVLPGIHFSAKLWKESSKETRVVFWDYLASLILLFNLNLKMSGSPMTSSESTKNSEQANEDMPDFTAMIDEMTKGFKSEEFKKIFENLKTTFDKFVDLSGNPAPTDASGSSDPAGDFKFPSIPERLQNGQIAKIAAELAGEFTPADLGIDAELMEKMNPIQIFEHLQFVYTNNPDLLTGAMKRVAKKIENKFISGSLKREELMAEAKELMEHFTDNPAFKEMFQTFGTMFTNPAEMFGGGNTGSASDRLQKARERLRKKTEEKKKGKK
jgi:ssDNA-specific exonuclease RecJ